ncbi:arsenate reductase/protein-tyrosine-phosphatase family protein [Arthrobacter cheniae]|uniref:arsenate reductase/protein-tyrosine-phosphatase family protein n=1 Tax=Arthrobacter cheniae TaxID=1258888 RepID=UPI0016039302|nr:low molecular weight phosphatase family protein [Arthrobacter cheniae]
MTRQLKILAVCTGNICRSPMVERLLQKDLDALFPSTFTVTSAGTRAIVGAPIDPLVHQFIQEAGGQTSNFSARQITASMIDDQDIILALTRDHRNTIVKLSPKALRRTFTLREACVLVANDLVPRESPPTDNDAHQLWASFPSRAGRLRVAPSERHNPDVIDPYGKHQEIYNQMKAEILPSVATLVNWTKGADYPRHAD